MNVNLQNVDLQELASQLATEFVQRDKTRYVEQEKKARETADGLHQLRKALQEFSASLNTLANKHAMLAREATLSENGIATVNVTHQAQPGQYTLFVEHVATAHQIVFEASAISVAPEAYLVVRQANGDAFSVALDTADLNRDATLSSDEIARAINQAPANAGKVNAMTLTINGARHVVVSAVRTGKEGAMTVGISNTPDTDAVPISFPCQELAKAKDAVVWLGERGQGMKIEQASNTFTMIDGVTLRLNRAMKETDAPLQLEVARSDRDSVANVQLFTEAYNALKKNLENLMAPAQSDKNHKVGPFAMDASVRVLRDWANGIVRQTIHHVRLPELGVKVNRDGSLTIDHRQLDHSLLSKPEALNALFFGSEDSVGLLKESRQYLDGWLNTINGGLKRREDIQGRVRHDLDVQKKRIDGQYQKAYQRYLKQYHQLQATQTQLSETMAMLNHHFY